MVFFTSILIVIILYYLQADGLIYVTVIALTAELANILMTHTLTQSVENRLKTTHKQATDGFSERSKADQKTIQEFEEVQENSVKSLSKANMRIKELEENIEVLEEKLACSQTGIIEEKINTKSPDPHPQKETKNPETFIDLPDASNRNMH